MIGGPGKNPRPNQNQKPNTDKRPNQRPSPNQRPNPNPKREKNKKDRNNWHKRHFMRVLKVSILYLLKYWCFNKSIATEVTFPISKRIITATFN